MPEATSLTTTVTPGTTPPPVSRTTPEIDAVDWAYAAGAPKKRTERKTTTPRREIRDIHTLQCTLRVCRNCEWTSERDRTRGLEVTGVYARGAYRSTSHFLPDGSSGRARGGPGRHGHPVRDTRQALPRRATRFRAFRIVVGGDPEGLVVAHADVLQR